MNVTTLGNLFFPEHEEDPPYVSAYADVVAISCAVQRFQRKNPQEFVAISVLVTDKFVEKYLLAEDYEKAKQIRQYYQQKSTFWALTNKNKSKFRQDLAEFLTQDVVKYKHSLLGLIYSLPFFYDYDLKLYDMSQKFNLQGISPFKGDLKLNYVGELSTNIRSSSLKEFWFTNENRQPVMITLSPKNPLMTVWHDYLERSNTITLTGRFSVNTDRDFHYLTADKWELKMVDK